jgi:hypothetical protein
VTSLADHAVMTEPATPPPVPAATPARGAPAALAWLLHPVTLVALAVLPLNDHVLKAAWPGPVTGKLSDVAGLALAPAAVTTAVVLLLPRLPVRAVAAVVTAAVGTAFALVKGTAAGAAAGSAAWSWASGPSTVLRDPTDLLALPALGVSWWAFARARRHVLPARAADLLRTAVVLPAAGLAILATSAGDYPYAGAVLVQGGSLVVVTSASGDRAYGAVATTDGRTWRDLAAEELARLPGPTTVPPATVPPATAPPATAPPATAPPATAPPGARPACVPAEPRRCYRTVPGRLAVEESADGGATWTDAWSITPGRQLFLERAYPEQRLGGPDVAALAVGVLPVEGGHVVAVATGRDGVLVRHADGRWERVGFPTPASRSGAVGARDGPPPLTAPGRRIAAEYVYAALGVSLGLLLGGFAATRRWRRAWWAIPVASAAYGYGVGQVAVIGAVLGVSSVPATLVLVALALLLWVGFVRFPGALTTGPAVVLAALGAATVVVGLRPVDGWAAGRTDDYDAAVRTATQLVGAGIAVMAVAGLAAGLLSRRSPADGDVRAAGPRYDAGYPTTDRSP